MVKFYIRTYGCAYNQADSENIEFFLKSRGHVMVDGEKEADVVVFNTCGVKDSTENRIVNDIKNSGKKVVATGCLAQARAKMISRLPNVYAVVGTFNNAKMLDAIEGAAGTWVGRGVNVPQAPDVSGMVSTVQVSSGCLGNCTFCQTKLARGNLKSFSESGLVGLVEGLVEKGCREVRLTSQDLGCYGFDFGDSSLPSLLEKIVEIEGDFKVRLGMMNPEHVIEIRKDLLKFLKNGKVYDFLHIPVQSGSDAVLEKMGRNYSVKDFRGLVGFLRRSSPDLTLETDVIVGFPTETEDDFQSTLGLMGEVRFDIVNFSKFSSRKGTKASFMEQLSRNEIKRRSVVGSRVYKRISLEKNLEMVGRIEKVLVTEKARGDFLGRTDSYKPVLVDGRLGERLLVEIKSAGQSHLRGVVKGVLL